MEKSIKSVVAPYGVYLGFALALITVLAYSINLDFFTKWWFNILNFAVILLVATLAVKDVKKSSASGISFKEAFTAYFIPVVIGTLISSVVNLLLFNLIDPEAAAYIMEQSIEMSRSMMERFGMPESEIEKAMAELEGENQFSPGNYARGYVFWLGFYAVVGLIVALIFRNKHSNKG